MKKLVTIAIAAMAGHLIAGTYTWTGANGDGLWFTAGNWNYDGAAATSSPGNTLNGDNVVIDGSGVVVTYVPGGDLITQAGTTLTAIQIRSDWTAHSSSATADSCSATS